MIGLIGIILKDIVGALLLIIFLGGWGYLLKESDVGKLEDRKTAKKASTFCFLVGIAVLIIFFIIE